MWYRMLCLLLLSSLSPICRHWSFYYGFLSFFSGEHECVEMCGCVCRSYSHTVTFVSYVEIRRFSWAHSAIDNERKSYSLKQLVVSTPNRFYIIQSVGTAHLFWHIAMYFVAAQSYCCIHWTIFFPLQSVCTTIPCSMPVSVCLSVCLPACLSANNGHMQLCM